MSNADHEAKWILLLHLMFEVLFGKTIALDLENDNEIKPQAEPDA